MINKEGKSLPLGIMKTQEKKAVELTRKVKAMAKELGADMVGIANVERFSNAPLMHSPQGLMPTSRSVVVVGVSYPDASIELSEKEISEYWYNTYDQCEILTNMNARLDTIVFNLSKLLENEAYESMPLPTSGPGYWRWRPYKSVEEPFAPPLAHRYAAVAAGLGEIGWHESFLSPEYGPRQRINSLISEAPLVPDPLYNGEPLCDKCMKCVKACPYDRFRKEVKGTKELDIGGKKFTIPITNKWRCFLCYFEINPRFIPQEITEEVASRITNHNPERLPKWIGDNAACLATCMPPSIRRKDDRLYPNSIARKREIQTIAPSYAAEIIKEKARKAGLGLFIGTKEMFLKKGINLEEYMPGASSALLFGTSYTDTFMENAVKERAKNLLFDLSHYLNDLGYYTLPVSRLDENSIKDVLGVEQNDNSAFQHILTELPLESLEKVFADVKEKKPISSEEVKSYILDKGADLAGISSAERMNKVLASLESIFAKDQTVVMENMPKDMKDWSTKSNEGFDVKAVGIKQIEVKALGNYLPDARSVIVLGVHYPYSLMNMAEKSPAENIGPYYAMNRFMPGELYSVGFDMLSFLRGKGYKAVASLDLEGIASQRTHTGNRFPAIAAGLGDLGWCGKVLTPEYGVAQNFVAIVTDADLTQDTLYDSRKLCKECHKCCDECPVNAISTKYKNTVKIEDKIFEFGKVDTLKCEWAKRFGFVGEAGPKYMGSKIDFTPPAKITAESVNKVLDEIKEMEDIERRCWNVSVEKCICPVKGNTFLNVNRNFREITIT